MVRRALAVALPLVASACGDPEPGTAALFVVPGAGPADEFYALPFPNDLRRYPDGKLDLSLFPTNSLIVDSYRAAIETHLDGFGLNSAMYARFDGALDAATLPDVAGSTEDGASVYLVDVDPDSSTRGQRVPIVVKFRVEGTETLSGNHLVARPYPGFPLAETTTYALVITNRVRAEGGGSVARPASVGHALGITSGGTAYARAVEVYAPLAAWLDEAGGDDRDDVVSAAVFTTQRATHVATALRKAVFALPAPSPTSVTRVDVNPTYTTFTGNYTAPNFQAGDVPYRNAPAGEIAIGADGAAIVRRMESLRFAITLPPGAVPANGWPLSIYSHGTGGSYTSFINDGTAARLAAEGIAVLSMDQVLHGPRNPGGGPEVDFFNFGNVFAARDNALQGAADAWSQLRLAHAMTLVDDARTHRFDATKMSFFGHSQGGITGPGFVAYEPSLSGAVLSGTAGVLYLSFLYKTEPFDIPQIVQTFIRDQPVDEDNPSLALVQIWIERSDPVNYAPLMARTPPAGNPARHVFQTEGFTDTYSPNPGIEAFATALGADVVQGPDTKAFPGMALRGMAIKPAPITNNRNGKTVVLGQYDQQPGSDGHFVVFNIPAASTQATKFLGTLARAGQATVVEVP